MLDVCVFLLHFVVDHETTGGEGGEGESSGSFHVHRPRVVCSREEGEGESEGRERRGESGINRSNVMHYMEHLV